MINLEYYYEEAINNLKTWIARYDKNEYFEKVALNLFYRRYTMTFMWEDIEMYIKKGESLNMFSEGTNSSKDLSELENIYSKTASIKVHPILISLLDNEPFNFVGGIQYAPRYNQLVQQAQFGDLSAKEELEFSYLYYFLSDKATLVWASLCSSGYTKIQAINVLSGQINMEQPIEDYTTINSAMGQLCVTPFLHNNYKPL